MRRPAADNSCTGPTACPPAEPIGSIEAAERARTIGAAQKIRGEHGITLDWLDRADRSMLPHHRAIEIARIEAAEQEI